MTDESPRSRHDHDRAWRDPAQASSGWPAADTVDPALFRYSVRGAFWDVLEAAKATLLVTREYEHLVIALSSERGLPRISYFPLPHPSGLVSDRTRNIVYVAATRNPNAIFSFRPTREREMGRALVPVASRYYPGRTYLHDLALVNGALHANEVGANAVVRVHDGLEGSLQRSWWPRCIETRRGPRFDRNYIQLNSIAAGRSLRESFFTASADCIGARRPGHRNFPVDGRGVVFSGATREPILRGLTRPHSARLHARRLFVANSGYGELGSVSVTRGSAESSRYECIARLNGWTRGLVFIGNAAIVGTSRVLPRFRSYAPGLDVDTSRCGLHVVDLRSGRIRGSLLWPNGNQLFALDWMPSRTTLGFPFLAARRRRERAERQFFFSYQTTTQGAKR
jgi:uncharacterized protein (TIGR03032 family)